jgi:Xaa-Pro aminopeptidase
MTKSSSRFCEKVLKSLSLDAFVFLDTKNIRYCCGFTGTDGAYIFTPQADYFLSDSRYQEQSRLQVAALHKICYQNKFDALIATLKDADLKRIGFEADTLSVTQLQELTRRSGDQLEWIPVSENIRPLRGRKTAAELELLQQAADLNHSAFAEVEGLIRPGISEKKIALELEFALRRLGGEDRAFDFIVASGPRGAMPHGVASDRLLETGELVTIDFGTRVAGYHSDETVTLGLGEVNQKLRRIFDVVLEAHDLAMAAAAPGIILADLDALARNHISAAGYGDYFGHGLGHGVGLDIHEYPTVSSRCFDQIEPGMVITIEPGIYVPQLGGVRIEDSVVITAKGCRALTKIPKRYCALG